MLFKKEDKFSVQLKKISTNLVKSTSFFTEYVNDDQNDLKDFAIVMKDHEHAGDDLVHVIIHELNKVFITPIEREDILALAMSMDDVLDGLESTAALFEMYGLKEVDEYMLEFTKNIQKATEEIDKAVDLLNKKKLIEMRRHVIRIKDYESKCDDVLRVSIKDLFQKEKDPIRIIQYKEIYEYFEDTADYCQDVANTFEAIIMKNA